MIVKMRLAKDLYVYLEGSGNPDESHEIVQVNFINDSGNHEWVGRDINQSDPVIKYDKEVS